MPPLLSVAIPAWRGNIYIDSAIRSVLGQPLDSMELVVSVHESDHETLVHCQKFTDPRLRVVHPPRTMGMAEHYEWCLEQMNGDWVTILGQDDGLMPHFSESVLDLLREFPDCEAFSFRRGYFFWPGCEGVYGNRGAEVRLGETVRLISSEKAIRHCLMGTREHYDFPQIYTNGLVRRSVVDAIRVESGGRFYHEMTPDVYSGFAVALYLGAFLEVDYPVFWTGTSPGSTGFSLSLDQGSHQTTVSKEIVDHHLRTARQAGLSTSDVVGPELWLRAASSAIFAASTLDCTPLAQGQPVGNSTFEIAIAALAGQLVLSLLPGFPSRAQRLYVWRLAINQARIKGLSLSRIYSRVPRLLAYQAFARFVFLFQDRLLFTHKSLRTKRGLLSNIDDANEWLASEIKLNRFANALLD